MTAATPRLLVLLLAMATLVVFWPVATCDFVNYDDGEYFTYNWQVLAGLTGGGIKWAFTTGRAANWHPLTWLSLMLDAQLFGPGASGPHIVNLLFHLANTLLLFAWLRRSTNALWPSALVAGLFALHPLHVESVAWISERKDVLSTFFFLLALMAYGRYLEKKAARREEAPKGDRVKPAPAPKPAAVSVSPFSPLPSSFWYVLALMLFALGLMSKPMVVTLPFVLLLLDYWPGQRLPLGGSDRLVTLRKLLIEKLPFFVLSGASCVVTLVAQAKGGAVRNLASLPLDARCENTLVAYARYLGKTVWPVDLAVLYPHPGHWPWLDVTLSGLLLAGGCFAALWLGRKFPFAVTGWFWFVGTLVPVIGLVQVGAQSMADRYMYVPLIGIAMLLAWGGQIAWSRWQLPRALGLALVVVVLGACAWQTRYQLGFWQNGESLFRHAVAVTKDNHQAMAFLKNDLANSLYRQGRLEEALANYQEAIRLYPQYELAHNNLGLALAAKGQFNEAMECYRRALQIYPGYVNAHVNLGDALRAKGQVEEAMAQYRQALQLEPRSVAALNNLAALLTAQGQYAEAVDCFQRAIRSAPGYTGAYKGLGKVLALQGRLPQAAASYQAALRLSPQSAELHYLLALVQLQQGNRTQAQANLEEALRLKPDYPEASQQLRVLTNAPQGRPE